MWVHTADFHLKACAKMVGISVAFLECHFGIYYFHTGRLCVAVKDIFVSDTI